VLDWLHGWRIARNPDILSCVWGCVSFLLFPIQAGRGRIWQLRRCVVISAVWRAGASRGRAKGYGSASGGSRLCLGLVNGESVRVFCVDPLSPGCRCSCIVRVVLACRRWAEGGFCCPTVLYPAVSAVSSQLRGLLPSIVIPCVNPPAWELLRAPGIGRGLPAR
jgi:hypothetical protein